jgi:serine/threonine protein kinase
VSNGGSGFVVGPATQPEAFELVALLGAGGEGEVWRARIRIAGPWGASGDDVAIKVARHDPDDTRWPAFAQLLTSLTHPGLVKVRGVFAGAERHRIGESRGGQTHRYVVMNFEPGLTLTQWLQEFPEASRAERTRLLEQVAEALDALHAGAAEGEPVVHGDIKPGNIMVRPDGSTVLVDLGLSRSTSTAGTPGHTTAYTAPELHSAATQATVEGDAYAFAVTTAQVLTGRPLPTGRDGRLSLDVLANQLRAGDHTRRHVLLTRHINRTLAAAPDGRPGQLARWLRRPKRQLQIGVSIAAVLLLMGSAAAAAAWPRGTTHPAAFTDGTVSPSSAPGSFGVGAVSSAHKTTATVGSTGSSTSAAVPFAQLSVTAKWSASNFDSCKYAAGDAVAGGGRFPANPDADANLQQRLIDEPSAGPWARNDLGLTFTVSGPGRIWLRDIQPVGRTKVQPPAWIYQDTGIVYASGPALAVCGSSLPPPPPPGTGPQSYGFTDRWRPDTQQNSISRVALGGGRSGQQFGQTVLRHIDTADVDIDTLACQGNYSFRFLVRYSVYGSNDVLTYYTPTFTIYGLAHRTVLLQTYTDDAGHEVQQTLYSGNSKGCAHAVGAGFPTPSPTPSPKRSSPTPTRTKSSSTAGSSPAAPPSGSVTSTP